MPGCTSCLILGFTESAKPIHIVFAVNQSEKIVLIITIYHPDEDKWEDEFQRRKS